MAVYRWLASLFVCLVMSACGTFSSKGEMELGFGIRAYEDGEHPYSARLLQASLDVGIGQIRGLGEHRRSVAVAEHEIVAGHDPRLLDAEVALEVAVDAGGGVERGALVAELVIRLRLVLVVGAAGIGVVMDREEEVGVERVGDPHPLREISMQRAVRATQEVTIFVAREKHFRPVLLEQALQLQRDAEIRHRLGEAVDSHRAAEEAAVSGIEDDDQLQRLLALHCEQGQGFLFARPMGTEEIAAFVDAHRAPGAAPRKSVVA